MNRPYHTTAGFDFTVPQLAIFTIATFILLVGYVCFRAYKTVKAFIDRCIDNRRRYGLFGG